MKEFIRRYSILIPVAFVLAGTFFSNSCANTTDAPTGGVKDTIPPVIKSISPKPGSVNIPTTGAKFVFTFDEYVVVKESKNIFLSPPLKKSPKSKVKGKSVVVWFEEELQPNTTYTLDLSAAIADNNEGNMFPGYTYVFSTGASIDSMFFTGTIQDFKSLQPMKGVTVMLYKDAADSAVFLHRPDAAVKTDDWGYFCLRNIQDTVYRIYAVKDAAADNMYDPQNDFIAFSDTVIRPYYKVNDTLKELAKFDMKDTVNCLSRRSDIEMRMFREKNARQMIMKTVRVADRTSYITFNAPAAHIDSMWIQGVPDDRLITQFNDDRDSLEIWVNDRKRMPDTLHLYVNYRKTDTTNALSPYLEHVKLFKEGVGKARKTYRKDIKHEDTICVFTLQAKPETVEQSGFQLEFKYPIIYEHFDSVKFMTVNPKQKESPAKFDIEPDPSNIRKYTLRPKVKLLEGWEYYFKVPKHSFQDINGFWCDSLITKVSLPKDEKLSSLDLELSGVGSKYLVDLLDEKKSTVIRSYTIKADETLHFPYLKAGKYVVRITEDLNENGMIDTGCLLERRQPEKVLFYKQENDNIMIDVPEAAEIVQTISISEMFGK